MGLIGARKGRLKTRALMWRLSFGPAGGKDEGLNSGRGGGVSGCKYNLEKNRKVVTRYLAWDFAGSVAPFRKKRGGTSFRGTGLMLRSVCTC